MEIAMSAPVLLFDGVCNFCDSAVQFIMVHERSPDLRFASLQSMAGKRLLTQHNLPTDHLDTLVYIEGEQTYVASAAAFRIARKLRWPWRALSAGRFLPKAFCDTTYFLFARYRYKIFGRKSQCRVPTLEERSRFLDAAEN